MTDETKKPDANDETDAKNDQAVGKESPAIESESVTTDAKMVSPTSEMVTTDAEMAGINSEMDANNSEMAGSISEMAKTPEKAAESKNPKDADEGPTFEGLMSLLDLESKPTSRAGWLIRAAVTLVGIILLWRNVAHLTGPMLATKPPTPIPTEELAGDKFRLSEPERKEIFKEFATAEIAERQRAITQNTWQGHAWSREDDRGYIERTTARAAAARHHCSLSQAYLVLDEGIREKWPGPDGKPLPATTPPFNPRTTW